jgi:hypothetical protein
MSKVQLLVPPLKGLNLYDNPLVMDPLYATELINFMPPTTILKARPGIVKIYEGNGQIRGLYSYITGQTISYAANWYDTTIKYGSAVLLIMKVLNDNMSCDLWAIDVNNPSDIKKIGSMPSGTTYNDDSCMYNHTMFLATGALSSPMYLYNQMKGFANFAWYIGDSASTQINNLENLSFFNSYLYANAVGTLDIFYIEASKADCLDPANSGAWWKDMYGAIFNPKTADKFSLEGIVTKSTRILKIAPIGRAGSDTLNGYLCVITAEGEVVLFEGTHAGDDGWKVVGKFVISPPLNKQCFSDMEGDLVIATQNGMVSLRRLVFGAATQISENLEYKTMSLFSQYMFQMPVFKDYFNLFYHPRNRTLIFNCPTQLPMPLQNIVVGYVFTKGVGITFQDPTAMFSPLNTGALKMFVINFIYQNGINYDFEIRFNGSENGEGIYYKFATTLDGTSATTTFSIQIKSSEDTPIDIIGTSNVPGNFQPGIVFTCPNFLTAAIPDDINISNNNTVNPNLEVKSQIDGTAVYYAYFFSTMDDFEVTSMAPTITKFYDIQSALTPFGIDGINKTAFSSVQPEDMKYVDFFSGLASQPLTLDSFFNNYLPAFNGQYWPAPTDFKFTPFNLWSPIEAFKAYLIDSLDAITLQGHPDDSFKTWHTDNLTYERSGSLKGLMPDGSYEDIPATWGISAATVDYTVFFYVSPPPEEWSIQNRQVAVHGLNFYLIGKNFRIFEVADDINNNYIFAQTWPYAGGYDTTMDFPGMTRSVNIPSSIFSQTPLSVSWTPNVDGTLTNTIPDDAWADFTGIFKKYFPVSSNFDENLYYGWMLSCVALLSIGGDPNANATNFDLASLPILKDSAILTNFQSNQYVFDSHFGTWSRWEDVNMMQAQEHNNEFYFVVPNNLQQNPDGGYMYSSFKLCKFDNAALGDYPSADGKTFTPINCRYKTTSILFDDANFKQFLRIRIFGNPNAFYQQSNAMGKNAYPFLITPESDFRPGQPVSYAHAFDETSMSQKVRKKHFGGRMMAELSRSEKKSFRKLYEDASQQIIYIEMPLIMRPGKRFAVQLDMAITEAFVNIYGFEVQYDSLQKD